MKKPKKPILYKKRIGFFGFNTKMATINFQQILIQSFNWQKSLSIWDFIENSPNINEQNVNDLRCKVLFQFISRNAILFLET